MLRLVAVLAAVFLVSSGHASAADSIEEIIVTATKREKSLREIPASIDAFDATKLEAQGQLSAAEFVERSPGVTISAGPSNVMKISIRGISTDTRPGGDLPPATGTFIGDTAFSDPYLATIQPDLSAFDLASVEILKGPQGTLFGGAALAGALRYVLQEPVMGEWQARGFAQLTSPVGGSLAWTEGVAVNVPLYSDRLAARLGYVHRQYPGNTDITRIPRRDDVDEGGGDQLRGILTWSPTDALKVKLTHLQQDFETDDATYTVDRRDARETDKFVLAQPADTGFMLDSLELGYDFESIRLVSLTSRTTKELNAFVDLTSGFLATPDGFPPELAFVTLIDNDTEAFAQELRLQSTGDGLKWLAGVYYYRYEYFVDLVVDTAAHQRLDPILSRQLLDRIGLGAVLDGLPGDLPNLFEATTLAKTVGDTTTTERAAFFDLSETFWDKLELSVGARVYQTEVRGGFTGDGLLVRSATLGQPIDATDNSLKERGISPKFGLVYDFMENLATYASISRGFRFGGVQSTPTTVTSNVPRTYKSDSLWNYELGLRTSWLDNTLQVDVTGFYIDYENPLLAQTTNDALALTYYDNVSAAISRGLEASVRWLTPVDGLILDLDGGLTDAHITESFTASNGTAVRPGAQMPGAAESQYSAVVSYLTESHAMKVGANVGYSYVGKGYNDITHSFRINDYGTLDTGLILASDSWPLRPQLTFNVANVLDETAVKGGHVASTVAYGDLPLYVLNQPRTFIVRMGLEF